MHDNEPTRVSIDQINAEYDRYRNQVGQVCLSVQIGLFILAVVSIFTIKSESLGIALTALTVANLITLYTLLSKEKLDQTIRRRISKMYDSCYWCYTFNDLHDDEECTEYRRVRNML